MNEAILYHYFSTELGELKVASYKGALVMADWRYRKMRNRIDQRITNYFQTSMQEGVSEIINETMKQLKEYFSKERKNFDLPMLMAGTSFQISVWNYLQQIPFGQTRSYAQLAAEMHQPEAIRAIASANGANAISIIIPCHRIIGSQAELVGYAGGLNAKKKLLMLEGSRPQIELF